MALNKNFQEFLSTFKSDKFKKLRANGQSYILEAYSDTYYDYKQYQDIAIELPTGAGKSLISLLIAEAWRQEGYKVAILTANKTLARQMNYEAIALGIPSVLLEGRGFDIPARDKRAYHRHMKIGIMNYWVYFNQNPVIDPADLLIMDDAHLAEHCLHSLYSVEIDKNDHNDLFVNIISELSQRFPEYAVLHDALDEDAPQNTPPELLSFIDQIAFSNRLKEIIDSSDCLVHDVDLKFRWDRMRGSINEANIYIGLNSMWIRPYIYPLEDNRYWGETKQRLYVSATIGDPDDLARRLGVRNINKIPVPFEFSERTNGRRLIVMNRIEEEDIPTRLQAAIIEALKIHPKSIWMCSSRKEAETFRHTVSRRLESNGFIGHPTWILTSLGDEIEQFKESSSGHLFVAGRFDGMDFKAEECRLVILATLPKAINLQEEFFCAYLRDSEFMSKRLNHRIIQALGRCNREETDYGVYVLADRRFATHFGRDSNRKGIPRNIIAEIDIAEDSAEETEDSLRADVYDFLACKFDKYDSKFRQAILEVPVDMPDFNETEGDTEAGSEVLGWLALFKSKNYSVAAENFAKRYKIAIAKNQIELGAFFGWCWAKAVYLDSLNENPGQRDKALTILEEAVVRGGKSSWFNRLRASLNRARRNTINERLIPNENCAETIIQRFDEKLESTGTRGTKFQKWADRIEKCLESEKHDEFLQGLKELGVLLGYNASSPRHSAATDCRWRGVFGNSKEVVTFEAKIEDRPYGLITVSDIGQAHVQFERAIAEYDKYGYSVRSAIVTHLTAIDPSAETSVGGISIIEKPAIISLWRRVRYILTEYRDGWSLDDIEARRTIANRIRSFLPNDGWLIRALDRDEKWIDESILLSEWQDNL